MPFMRFQAHTVRYKTTVFQNYYILLNQSLSRETSFSSSANKRNYLILIHIYTNRDIKQATYNKDFMMERR